jgi:radical SAM/Cys-rich protein
MSSLLSRGSKLSSSAEQIQLLEMPHFRLPTFSEKLKSVGFLPLKPMKIEIFQINLGKMCNQTCHHCHVDAGPDRKEIMTKETMEKCLKLIRAHNFPTVDLTGGAPEMNPHFRWFVEELQKSATHIIDRCNLTIIRANKSYNDLPEFFKKNKIEVVSSLPHFSKDRTDRQRGQGVFDKSIMALQSLNQVGYGKKDTGLILNLVYNPTGSFLPSDQSGLEAEFKKKLYNEFKIEFNNLYCITNMPISRYLEYLINSGNYEDYMTTLVQSFNAAAVEGVMCRNTISIGWDGKLYDCDFNQMLDLPIEESASQHLDDFDKVRLENRNIVIGQHCFGCTAGSGSSCGGKTT